METTVGIEDNTDLINDINLNQYSKIFVCPEFIMIFAKWDLRDTSKLGS